MQAGIDATWLAGLVLTAGLGVVLTVVRLPGTWLILVAAALHAWHTGWLAPGWPVLAVLLVMAVAAEVIELLTSVVTTRRAGASGRASWCALAGGLVGMIALSFPVPIIGTVIGGIVGCFIGAAIGELTVRHDLVHGAKVGLFAAIGLILGTVAKTMFALLMAVTAVVAAVWG